MSLARYYFLPRRACTMLMPYVRVWREGLKPLLGLYCREKGPILNTLQHGHRDARIGGRIACTGAVLWARGYPRQWDG